MGRTVKPRLRASYMALAWDYLRRWLRWQPCRDYGGCYRMLLLASPLPIPFDCYLFRFLDGAEIPPHRDPVPSGRHYRLNIILKQPRSGGEFTCSDTIFDWNRVKFFRPDRSLHSVTKVQGGARYVLSFGWVLR